MKPLLTALLIATTAMAAPRSADAHDGQDYLGSVFLFALAGNGGSGFCPRGTLLADGSLLQISQYTALFSLFGAFYGGDGRTTFALPDFRDAAPSSANGTKMGYCVVAEGVFPSRS